MERINLSRLHSSINSETGIIGNLTRKLEFIPMRKTMRIFQKTTQADMQAFINRCTETRNNFLENQKNIMRHELYLSYLKSELEKGNKRAQVHTLLMETAAMQRRISRLEEIRRIASSGLRISNEHDDMPYAIDMDEIQPAEVYKSTYTENNKIYDLSVLVFGRPELEKIDTQIENLQKELRARMDKLASANQKTFVSIMTFEEFSASAETPAP